MKVSKWVDMGQEVDVEIGADDIRCALAEAFAVVTEDRLGEEGPNRNDVTYALNSIGAFLKALTDDQIALLGKPSRKLIKEFLETQAKRFAEDVAHG
jgi:hypothetical protein